MKTIAIAHLVLLILSTAAFSQTPGQKNWFENLFVARGGCFPEGPSYSDFLNSPRAQVMGGNINANLFGKPAINWSGDDVAVATRIFKDCEASARAHGNGFAAAGFKRAQQQLGDIIAMARKLDTQRKAEQEARIALLKQQADADKKAATDANAKAQRESAELAEATREAGEARRARQEAERKLAEIRAAVAAKQKEANQNSQADVVKNSTMTKQGWIGVNVQQVTPDLAYALSIDAARGALIAQVHQGGPAVAAGLVPSDVIIKVDGQDINSPEDLIRIISATPVGKKIDILVIRNTKQETHSAVVQQKPAEVAEAPVPARDDQHAGESAHESVNSAQFASDMAKLAEQGLQKADGDAAPCWNDSGDREACARGLASAQQALQKMDQQFASIGVPCSSLRTAALQFSRNLRMMERFYAIAQRAIQTHNPQMLAVATAQIAQAADGLNASVQLAKAQAMTACSHP